MSRTCRIAFLSLSVLALSSGAMAGMNDGWLSKMKLTFSGYNKPETLTNFPVLIVFSNGIASGFSYGGFLSATNADLRFADSTETTALNYEIENWDTNGSSCVWVQVPALATSNDYIWAYWGKSGTNAPPCTTNGATWNNSFKGVWHFPSPTTLTAADSVSNGHNGTVSGATASTGQIGGAAYFNGSAKIQMATIPSPQLPLTIEFWANTPSALPSGMFDSAPSSTYTLRNNLGYMEWWNMSPQVLLGLTQNQWTHLAFVFSYDGTRHITWYKNGVAQTTGNGDTTSTVTWTTPAFGSINGGAIYTGLLDEFRVSAGARSPNWVWASWLNQASNAVFVSCATVLSLLPNVSSGGATGVRLASAWLNGTLVSTGAADTAVSVYWGTSDGGTIAGAWAHTNTWAAPQSPGNFTTYVTGLSYHTPYYYRFFATNSYGGFWSISGSTFTTPLDLSVWPHKLKVTFSGYSKQETLTNFPAPVVLSTNITGFRYGDFRSYTNGDLRFADASETTALNYEIESWNTNGSSYVWVQVPALASSNDYIYAYWGMSNTNAAPCTTNGAVWDSNFRGVWHLGESSGNAADSTTNGNTGVSASGVTRGPALIDGGAAFDGVNGKFTVSSTMGLGLYNVTMESWAYITPSTHGALIKIGDTSAGYAVGLGGTDFSNVGMNFLGLYENARWLNPGVSMGAGWHHFVLVVNGGSPVGYLDASPTVIGGSSPNAPVGAITQIGGYSYNGRLFNGTQDEVRVSSTIRSSNWIWASFMSQGSNSVFNTYGMAQSPTHGAAVFFR